MVCVLMNKGDNSYASIWTMWLIAGTDSMHVVHSTNVPNRRNSFRVHVRAVLDRINGFQGTSGLSWTCSMGSRVYQGCHGQVQWVPGYIRAVMDKSMGTRVHHGCHGQVQWEPEYIRAIMDRFNVFQDTSGLSWTGSMGSGVRQGCHRQVPCVPGYIGAILDRSMGSRVRRGYHGQVHGF
jgi:hypothetical protein